LIGTVSIFLGSKYDDLYHIPLKAVMEKIAHDSFTK